MLQSWRCPACRITASRRLVHSSEKTSSSARLETRSTRPGDAPGTSDDGAARPRRRLEQWQIQKQALKDKFGDAGWSPRKKLSPSAMDGLRALHTQDPVQFSTPRLAQQFAISPEAVRRILKSKWRPKDDFEAEDRSRRWKKRGERLRSEHEQAESRNGSRGGNGNDANKFTALMQELKREFDLTSARAQAKEGSERHRSMKEYK
ncbi:Required for respiratory growth protein 9 mitochondrial [Savitreella phatthalungensis]